MSSSYRMRQLGRLLSELDRQSRDLNASRRLPFSSYDGTITQTQLVPTGEVDEHGEPVMVDKPVMEIGRQPDGSSTVVITDGPHPVTPGTFRVRGGNGVLSVAWSGGFVGEPYADWARIIVLVAPKDQVDSGQAIFPDAAWVRGSITDRHGGELVIGSLPQAEYYITLVSVSQAGLWSDTADIVTGNPGEPTAVDLKKWGYYQPTPPTGLGPGDVDVTWWDTTDGAYSPHRWDGTKWVDSAPLITADKILSGSLQVGTVITMGNPLDAHSAISANGLTVYSEPDPETGVQDVATRIGTGSDDLLTLAGGEARVDGAGRLTAAAVSIPNAEWDSDGNMTRGLSIYGAEFSDWMWFMPKGLVEGGYGARDTVSSVTSSEIPYLALQFHVEEGRAYRISTNTVFCHSTTAGTRHAVRLRWAVSGNAGVTSTELASDRQTNAAAGTVVGLRAARVFQAYNTADISVLLTYAAETNAGSIYANANAPIEITVEDIGPIQEDTGIDRSGPTTTSRTYTSVWNCNSSATYAGTSTAKATSDAQQGVIGFGVGDYHSTLLFTGGAISGEKGKTIAQATSGATISKVEVYLYANHWYYQTGTSIIRTHSLTSQTGVAPTGNSVRSAAWPRGWGRWVPITNIWTASTRGVWLGKTGTSDRTFYGYFDGASSSRRPQIRMTYTRRV